MDYIAENIRHIRAQMEEAALRAGRDPKETFFVPQPR